MHGSPEKKYYSNLYRLSHAHKLLRLYRETTGQTFETSTEVVSWLGRQDLDEPIECDALDLQIVQMSSSVEFLEELYRMALDRVPDVFGGKMSSSNT